MKRVEENAIWTLFDPAETGDLCEVFGEELRDVYIAYEQNENVAKEYVPAKELWKKSLLAILRAEVLFYALKITPIRLIEMTIQVLLEVQTYVQRFSKIHNQITIKIKIVFNDRNIYYL